MAARIVVGVFESEGIAEDARNRLKTEGVPASDIVLKVLKEIGPIPSTMEPEIEASFLGPVILGNFRESSPSGTDFACQWSWYPPGANSGAEAARTSGSLSLVGTSGSTTLPFR